MTVDSRGCLMDRLELLYSLGGGKSLLDPSSTRFNTFISAYNLSERVKIPFTNIISDNKFWLIHGEYHFTGEELPSDAECLSSDESSESDFVNEVMSKIPGGINAAGRVAIDITGFMRPHLMFLMAYLKNAGVLDFSLIYTEPSQYFNRAETVFSSDVAEVRQVNGFEGTHDVDMSNDLLVVGVGYDHDLINQVHQSKSGARLLQLLSLPSLSPDMYQESLVRLSKLPDAPFEYADEQLAFASANDPFHTCMVLYNAIARFERMAGKSTNIYLSPLATKPQAVGFALYYMKFLQPGSASIVVPITNAYTKETSKGVGRTWVYDVHF